MAVQSDITTSTATIRKPYDEITGWRLALIFLGLSILLLLAFMDETIVATAIVAVSIEFQDFSNALWIVLGYTLTFLGFTVFACRLADVYGRRPVVLVGAGIFTVFSLAAGFATSMNQLIAFRAVQGCGASLMYSVGILCFPEMAPLRLLPLASSIVGVVLAVANAMGPVLGGILTSYASWRWNFWISPPIALPAITLLLFVWPKDAIRGAHLVHIKLPQVDWLGIILLLIFTTMFTFSVQQAGVRVYAWDSPIIVAMLTIACLALVGLVGWSYWLVRRGRYMKIAAALPWMILSHRILALALLVTLLTGFTGLMVIIWLPVFFQIVNVLPAVQAGVHLLPSVILSAVGAALGGLFSARTNHLFPTLIAGNILLLIACGLFSILPSTLSVAPICYAAQVLGGLGAGMIFTVTVYLTSLHADFADHAVGQGLIAQMRVLGGTLGVTMGSALFGKHVAGLGGQGGILSGQEVAMLYRNPGFIAQLDLGKQIAVRQAFADSWNEGLRICMYVAAASLVLALGTWERRPVSVEARKLQLEKAIESGPGVLEEMK